MATKAKNRKKKKKKKKKKKTFNEITEMFLGWRSAKIA